LGLDRIKERMLEQTISAWTRPARAIFGPPVKATSPSAKMVGLGVWTVDRVVLKVEGDFDGDGERERSCKVGETRIRDV